MAADAERDPAKGRKMTRLPGLAAVPALDRVIHERVRLAIMGALAVNDHLTFTELRDLLELTDGNLSVHARRLEEARYLACAKGYDGRTPISRFRITRKGRKALERYLGHMEALIEATRGE